MFKGFHNTISKKENNAILIVARKPLKFKSDGGSQFGSKEMLLRKSVVALRMATTMETTKVEQKVDILKDWNMMWNMQLQWVVTTME